MHPPVVFVTDYGLSDTYAASLTGAAWAIEPGVRCVDGTHGVPAGDVLAGAYHLKALALAFDRRCVLCGVVDPGVGTARRALAAEIDGCRVVVPDNGLITYLWQETPPPLRRAVSVDVPDGISATFHGRDVFAPTAAQLATGSALSEIGDPVDDPVLLTEALAVRDVIGLQGRVCVVDHFGNAITTVREEDLGGAAPGGATWEGGSTQQVVATYDDIAESTLALLVGSAGHMEIAARGAPAASLGGPAPHAPVTVQLL